MQNHNYLAPGPEAIQKKLAQSVSADTVVDAEDWFVTIKERLLDVNEWRGYSDSIADFTLTDTHGRQLKRHAHKGDYIRIDSPRNGFVPENSHDWMRVAAIVYDDYPDDDRETIALHLSPTSNPMSNDHHEANHLFSDIAHEIVLERIGTMLTCWYSPCDEGQSTPAFQVVPWADIVTGLVRG